MIGLVVDTLKAVRAAVRTESGANLDRLIEQFGTMNAAELELRATIVYVAKGDQSLSESQVVEVVGKIKPKFPADKIRETVSELRTHGIVGCVRDGVERAPCN